MKRHWIEKSIDQLAFVGRGKSRHRPRNDPSLYGGQYPFVQTAEIHSSDLRITTFSQTYSDKGLAQSKMWEPGTICITNAGENTGDSAILGIRACFPDSVIAVIAAPSKADTIFLKYAIDLLKPKFRRITRGATQDNLSVSKLISFTFPTPPLDIQQKIGKVLLAYGDLIENNRRRIQLLEQAARLLYKEWFVHLRFPGHEHVKIKDGVPEGWEVVPLSNFCKVGRGGSPRPIKNYLDGVVPWFKIGDATASESPFVFSTSEKIIENGVKKSVFLPSKELILSNSATCGIPYFTGISGCIHDGWLHFKKLRKISKWFLYCCLFEKQRAILLGIGDGATQKNLNTDYIGRQLILLSKDSALLEYFNSAVEPLFAQVFTLAQTNTRLREARDLLLPRLMTGEVAV